MNRNPNNRSPRQLRDCTFQEWADPLERPAPKQKWLDRAAISGIVLVVVILAWGFL